MKSILPLLLTLMFFSCAHDESSRPASADTATSLAADNVRRFKVRYVADVGDLPVGRNLRLWIPIPSDDPWQTITGLNVHANESWAEHRITKESVYGNRMVHIDARAATSSVQVEISYVVDRRERLTDLDGYSTDGRDDGSAAMYLRPERLVAVNDRIAAQRAKIDRPDMGTLARGRAYYDFVLDQMTYGKPEGLAWGRGDTIYACDARVGNCTDFHAWFMSLCRSAKIPARFEIGIYGDYATKTGEEYETGGYHCWAEFHVPGRGWVPVDISEADKDANRADYFFGAHTNNRVTLSRGRDLVLEPRQVGEPLNYHLAPYAEVDGVKHAKVAKKSYWKDL